MSRTRSRAFSCASQLRHEVGDALAATLDAVRQSEEDREEGPSSAPLPKPLPDDHQMEVHCVSANDYLKLMIYGLESASRRYDEARRTHAPGRERKRTGTQPKDCSLIASPLACEYSPRVVVCVV